MKKWIGNTWLRVAGWKLEGEAPAEKRYVLIAAPHTSNWDLPFMLACSYIYELPMHWMGKDTLFKPPLGWLLAPLGGFAIDRSKAGGVVQQMTERFADLAANDEGFVLAVPAEGTRGKKPMWKSGFYHIARSANVPIALSYLDWKTKRTGIGKVIHPSGDIQADMDQIRAFYEGMEGRIPGQFTPPLLREELGAEDPSASVAKVG